MRASMSVCLMCRVENSSRGDTCSAAVESKMLPRCLWAAPGLQAYFCGNYSTRVHKGAQWAELRKCHWSVCNYWTSSTRKVFGCVSPPWMSRVTQEWRNKGRGKRMYAWRPCCTEFWFALWMHTGAWATGNQDRKWPYNSNSCFIYGFSTLLDFRRQIFQVLAGDEQGLFHCKARGPALPPLIAIHQQIAEELVYIRHS